MMAESFRMDRKDQEEGAESSRGEAPSSSIIGLEFIDGRVLYCHRSTLINAGGYFAACFGDNGIPVSEQRKDEHGRSVYFVERDADVFQQHDLPYILTKRPGKFPPFSKDPELWRVLRDEALFYGLDELSELLHVTSSYIPGGDKGVLYWLGTRKGQAEYRNPYDIGAVNVTVGGITDATYKERSEIPGAVDDDGEPLLRVVDPRAYAPESRQALVQYRPPVRGKEGDSPLYSFTSLHGCYSLDCRMSTYKFPTVVHLLSIKLRLTAYSLRKDCCGMTDWNLEGSEDGSEWTVLHEARNDRRIAKMDASLQDNWGADLNRTDTIAEGEAVTLEFVERERRGTWQILPGSDTFYRFFRIIGSGTGYERSEDSSTCMHGVGLELYGDVHEE